MVRYFFPGETMIRAHEPGIDLDAYLAPATSFTVWTEPSSGVDVSAEMRAGDGVTVVPLVSDSSGNRPHLRGPDGEKGPLWCDTGVGQRFAMYSSDAIAEKLGEDAQAGAGLPAGTTLEDIPNGETRLALSQDERTKLEGIEVGATRLLLGTTDKTAKPGNYTPKAAEIGAVVAVDGPIRMWRPRLASQALPTAAEGALDGDIAFQEAT